VLDYPGNPIWQRTCDLHQLFDTRLRLFDVIDSLTSTVSFVIQEGRNSSSLDLAVHICQNAFLKWNIGVEGLSVDKKS
jgi:hypothetical protein